MWVTKTYRKNSEIFLNYNKSGLFVRELFPVSASHPFFQTAVGGRCRSGGNLVALADEDVFGEGLHIVGFQKQDVVA